MCVMIYIMVTTLYRSARHFATAFQTRTSRKFLKFSLRISKKPEKNKRAAFVPAEKEVREKYVYESKMKNYAKVPKNFNIIWILMYVMHIDVF